MARMTSVFAAVSALVASGAVANAGTVAIMGLTMPTSVAWDEAGRVYVSEKSGLIKVAQNFTSTSATVLLDLRNQTVSYGDLGLETLEFSNGYLYAGYMTGNNPSCSDRGQPNGRPASQILGCVAYGRVSRWPVSNGVVTGPEQRLIDENSALNICNQFGVNPIDYIMVGTDGNIYGSAGAGSNSYATDYGQFGMNPCGTGAQWGGAFRSQDLQSLDGKIFRYNPTTQGIEIIARGLNDPWRFTVTDNGDIYTTDAGNADYEEINGPIALATASTGANSVNFGFPCFENNDQLSAYQSLNSSVCQNIGTVRGPIYSYTRPDNSTRVSISALAVYNNRFYYGDYSQSKLFSVGMDGTGMRVEKANAWPVDIAYVPGVGLVYVDVAVGAVKSFTPIASGAVASGVGALGAGVAVAAVLAAALL